MQTDKGEEKMKREKIIRMINEVMCYLGFPTWQTMVTPDKVEGVIYIIRKYVR